MTTTECKQVFDLLSDYLDGELPPGLCDRIATHIERCPPCIEFVESLRRTVELCRQSRALEKPGPLPEALREELLAAYKRLGNDLL